MMNRKKLFVVLCLLAAVFMSISNVSAAKKTCPANGKLKIFIVSGQSNMVGFGQLKGSPGTMETYVKSNPKDYGHLVDKNGKHVVRDDVWIVNLSYAGKEQQGPLTTGYGASEGHIGPEYAFGFAVGDYYQDPVLLIKSAWGGRSLSHNFLPPSSKEYPKPVKDGDAGFQYSEVLRHVKEITGNLKKYYPGYTGKGYEIVGFGWHQGWNDRINQAAVDVYEENMVNFIKDIRKDLGIKKMPFVIANTGMGGWNIPETARYKKKVEKHMAAQLAPADAKKYPEFKGNVGGVETRGFQRTHAESPSRQDFHWMRNWETLYLIGKGMGDSMVDLLFASVSADGKKVDSKGSGAVKPVKVFIVLGQSNVLGYGHVGPETTKGTLEYYIKKENKYPYLLDEKGGFKAREDVWCVQVTSGRHKGWLAPGFGNRRNFVGIELGFGFVVGDVLDEEVLIIKTAVGNRALGWDIMPPSSRTISPKDHVDKWYQGYQLDAYIKDTHRVLKNIKKYYPSYKGQGYEVAGFVWWQGHKDQSTPGHVLKPPYNISYPDTYEKNLVNLIKDLRKEFKAPKAPFVLATIAFDGKKLGGGGLKVANAQLAVSGEKGKYPEFKGNVKTIEARKYWRAKDVSPSGAGYHYNHNAGTYMDVGVDLGKAMAKMLAAKKK